MYFYEQMTKFVKIFHLRTNDIICQNLSFTNMFVQTNENVHAKVWEESTNFYGFFNGLYDLRAFHNFPVGIHKQFTTFFLCVEEIKITLNAKVYHKNIYDHL